MSSEEAAITALAGRGDTVFPGSSEYRFLLPQLSSGDSMTKAVVLLCDMAGRPYRIEDFRQPLDELGVLREVAGIGAYQMSHVWLLDLRTDAAKLKLANAGRLAVKGRTCIVVDPSRQEVRIKLHWVAFDVSNDTIRKAFSEYGEVKDVASDRWKVPGFEGAESTTRIGRLVLREGVNLDRLPHQLRFGGGLVLVVVPGRAPVCLRCRRTGHIRRDCRAPRCSECRAYGHERDDCVRSYARAVGRGVNEDHVDDIMDEEEAERASAPVKTQTEQAKSDDASGTSPEVSSPVLTDKPSTAAPADPPAVERSTVPPTGIAGGAAGASPLSDEVSITPEMDVELGSAKRRFEDVTDTTGQELRLRQIERRWRMMSDGSGVDGHQRSGAVLGGSHDKLSQ
ncbi:uncharacterized protein ISCGN_003642 [Ixodes scapularis]